MFEFFITPARTIDDLLHARSHILEKSAKNRFVLLAFLTILLAGATYGAAMGTYGELRPLQMLYSGIKLPLLILLSFSLTLPAFYVLNALLGLRADFSASLRAVTAAQVGMTIFLASLAPVTIFWYASFGGYQAAKIFNLLAFALAALYAYVLLRKFYSTLIYRNPVHRILVRVWIVLFAFIAIQLSWMLRPFVGNPAHETRFLREDAMGNAYIEIGHMFIRLLTG